MTHVQQRSSGPPRLPEPDAATLSEMLAELVDRVKAVRRWLVLLAVLKALTLGLVCGSIYIAGYAVLDHYFAFGAVTRVLFLVVLVAGLAYLLVHFLRALAAHISCRNAANHVERELDLQQQLVTVVEFSETRDTYAYSEALARRLVHRVHRLSADRDFLKTIPRKRALLFAVVMLVGLVFLGFYARDNYRFFSPYLARLVQPLSPQAPLGALQLETLTGDIVAQPDSVVPLAASITGRLPNEGTLTVEPMKKGSGAASEDLRTLALAPTYGQNDEARFAVEVTLADGRYRYRFESGGVATKWHTITMAEIPAIESIVAAIRPPEGATALDPYTEPVEEHTLEVYRNARIQLTVEASQSLSAAAITGLAGEPASPQTSGQAFEYGFEATREGFLKFQLTNADGLVNGSIPDLQILLKEDKPPALELKSPGGDYLATNVASIPIEFTITDDFGLAEAELVVEVADREPITVPARLEAGANQAHVGHTLDLDAYDLSVGDSILYYAKAVDTATGLKSEPSTAASELFLIEIKPYRQRWHAASWNLPGQSPQGLEGPKGHARLSTILEWTRAIVKKTFVIAGKSTVDDQDAARLDAINADLGYATEQLSLVRDDTRSPEAREAIDGILDEFRAAERALREHDAPTALVHEKEAYQRLRKLLLILDRLVPLPVGGGRKGGPDAVKLEEQVHVTRFEAERIEWELKRLANRLEELEEQEAELARRFEHFLEHQAQAKRPGQATTDAETWTDTKDRPLEDIRLKPPKPGDGPESAPSMVSVDGALPVPGPTQGGGSMPQAGQSQAQNQSQAQAQGEGDSGQGKGQGNKASREQRMNMLRAQQQALRQVAESLKNELGRLPLSADDRDGAMAAERKRARERIEEAIRAMDRFEKALAKAYFDPKEEEAQAAEAREALDDATRLLADARDALAEQIDYSDEERRAQEYEQMARRLERLAKEYDTTKDPVAREELQRELAKASAMLPDVAVGRYSQHAPGEGYSGPAVHDTANTPNAPSAAPGGDVISNATPEDAAHFLAREFWTRAVEAKKQRSDLSDRDASDAAFHRYEKRFFENAAKYGQ